MGFRKSWWKCTKDKRRGVFLLSIQMPVEVKWNKYIGKTVNPLCFPLKQSYWTPQAGSADFVSHSTFLPTSQKITRVNDDPRNRIFRQPLQLLLLYSWCGSTSWRFTGQIGCSLHRIYNKLVGVGQYKDDGWRHCGLILKVEGSEAEVLFVDSDNKQLTSTRPVEHTESNCRPWLIIVVWTAFQNPPFLDIRR